MSDYECDWCHGIFNDNDDPSRSNPKPNYAKGDNGNICSECFDRHLDRLAEIRVYLQSKKVDNKGDEA